MRSWVDVLEEGYQAYRENTPKFVLYYFPPARLAGKWITGAEAGSRKSLEHLAEILDQFLSALQLHKPAYVALPGSRVLGMIVDDYISHIREASQGHQRTPTVPYMHNPRSAAAREPLYRLVEADVEPIEQLLKETARAFKTRLAIALRRFVNSREKPRPDRFIDLLITLEVLYGDRDPTSAAHKISFRAAAVTGTSARGRAKTMQLLKRAYTDRSKIVHGRSAGAELTRLEDVERVVRRSLRWFLAETSRTGRAPEGATIDNLCFGATGALSMPSHG